MPSTSADAPRRCHVVIAGAGPAGILAAINFLRRNKGGAASVEYSVSIVDPGEDFGELTPEGLEKKRSWMIGLSAHGLAALRRVPGLYTDHVSKVGVPIHTNAIYLGKSKFMASDANVEGFVVDRNFVVAAMARCLNDAFKDSGLLTRHYNSRVLYVDPDCRRVCVRGADGADNFVSYDLLIGADGIRSPVRAAFIRDMRDFTCSIRDTFSKFKSVHIPLPEGLEGDAVHLLPECLRGMNGIGLPETGGKINVAMGWYLDNPPDEGLMSDDTGRVEKYLRAQWKAFPLPFEDFARQFVAQPWSTTGQVHCNLYHSEKLCAIIMGDAAHATSPSIGQGMNTALADAAALDVLLDSYLDDLAAVLPAFSVDRVKEGNALTDVAFYAFSMSAAQQLRLIVGQMLRNAGAKYLPSFISPDAQLAVAKGGKLSAAYAELTRTGWIPSVRAVNDTRMRKHFELSTGMVPTPAPRGRVWASLRAMAVITVVVVLGLWAGGVEPAALLRLAAGRTIATM